MQGLRQGLLLVNALSFHMNSYEPAAKLKNILPKIPKCFRKHSIEIEEKKWSHVSVHTDIKSWVLGSSVRSVDKNQV